MGLSIAEAEAIVGGLSKPSKMPGYAYGLPARACVTGSRLVKIKGSVCSGCYALKGRYAFPNVQNAQYRRLAALKHPRWTEAMVTLINNRNVEYFRWHDSGDVQDVEHLERIVEVAHRCPGTHFWLPTREKETVRSYLRARGAFPENLVVRVSGTMIDGPPPTGFANTSTVISSKILATCPAQYQNNECGTCRACWAKEVLNVSYPKH